MCIIYEFIIKFFKTNSNKSVTSKDDYFTMVGKSCNFRNLILYPFWEICHEIVDLSGDASVLLGLQGRSIREGQSRLRCPSNSLQRIAGTGWISGLMGVPSVGGVGPAPVRSGGEGLPIPRRVLPIAGSAGGMRCGGFVNIDGNVAIYIIGVAFRGWRGSTGNRERPGACVRRGCWEGKVMGISSVVGGGVDCVVNGCGAGFSTVIQRIPRLSIIKRVERVPVLSGGGGSVVLDISVSALVDFGYVRGFVDVRSRGVRWLTVARCRRRNNLQSMRWRGWSSARRVSRSDRSFRQRLSGLNGIMIWIMINDRLLARRLSRRRRGRSAFIGIWRRHGHVIQRGQGLHGGPSAAAVVVNVRHARFSWRYLLRGRREGHWVGPRLSAGGNLKGIISLVSHTRKHRLVSKRGVMLQVNFIGHNYISLHESIRNGKLLTKLSAFTLVECCTWKYR